MNPNPGQERRDEVRVTEVIKVTRIYPGEEVEIDNSNQKPAARGEPRQRRENRNQKK